MCGVVRHQLQGQCSHTLSICQRCSLYLGFTIYLRGPVVLVDLAAYIIFHTVPGKKVELNTYLPIRVFCFVA